MLGRDLNKKQDGLVVFRDGSFADGKHFFINSDSSAYSSGCREVETLLALDCRLLEKGRRDAQERLKISDLIITGNLIPAHDASRISQNLWLSELPPPQAHSKELGLTHIKVKEANMEAHPPSGAVFAFKADGRPAQLFSHSLI